MWLVYPLGIWEYGIGRNVWGSLNCLVGVGCVCSPHCTVLWCLMCNKNGHQLMCWWVVTWRVSVSFVGLKKQDEYLRWCWCLLASLSPHRIRYGFLIFARFFSSFSPCTLHTTFVSFLNVYFRMVNGLLDISKRHLLYKDMFLPQRIRTRWLVVEIRDVMGLGLGLGVWILKWEVRCEMWQVPPFGIWKEKRSRSRLHLTWQMAPIDPSPVLLSPYSFDFILMWRPIVRQGTVIGPPPAASSHLHLHIRIFRLGIIGRKSHDSETQNKIDFEMTQLQDLH
jgi:hypothetical protein